MSEDAVTSFVESEIEIASSNDVTYEFKVGKKFVSFTSKLEHHKNKVFAEF